MVDSVGAVLNNPSVGGLPFAGASGREYATLADAIAGEFSGSVADTTQAGTTNGVVVGSAALNPADDFYNNDWIVLTDLTPGNGLVCRRARVVDYVGATRTLTIDQPWDFGVGEAFTLTEPARIWMMADAGDGSTVTVNVDMELNLEGHWFDGGLDKTSGIMMWIRGAGGYIDNGITVTTLANVQLDNLNLSVRSGTIYAFLMTNGSNLGRAVLNNCQFEGVVAGRRGFIGWEITNCRNNGVSETDQNVPYRPVESAGGVAVVTSNVDVAIIGEYAGCIFYSSDAVGITGSPAISIQATIALPKPLFRTIDGSEQPTSFAQCWVNGVGVITLTPVAGSFSSITIPASTTVSPQTPTIFTSTVSMLRAINFTGAVAVTQTNWACVYTCQTIARLSQTCIAGTIASTGNITFTAGFSSFAVPTGNFHQVHFAADYRGTLNDSHGVTATGSGLTHRILFDNVTITTVGPTVTLSGTMTVLYTTGFSLTNVLGTTTVSLGTWVISGAHSIKSGPNSPIVLTSNFTGGTWTISGNLFFDINGTTNFAVPIVSIAGSNLTVNVTSPVILICGLSHVAASIVSVTGAGSVVTVSGGVVTFRGFRFTTAFTLVTATTATSTAICTSSVSIQSCEFEAAFTVFNATAIGGVAQAPATLTFYDCVFESTFTDRSGAGTLTLAAATWKFFDCTFAGLVTLTGTSFTTWEMFQCTLNAGPIAITCLTGRPGTYRIWGGAITRGLAKTFLPERIRVWTTWNSAVAIVAGDGVTINNVPDIIPMLAAGQFLKGIALDAGAGAGAPVVVVHDGDIFVSVDVTVVAPGTFLVSDLAGIPTNGIGSLVVVPGSTIGYTYEAGGATKVGKAFTEVNVS